MPFQQKPYIYISADQQHAAYDRMVAVEKTVKLVKTGDALDLYTDSDHPHGATFGVRHGTSLEVVHYDSGYNCGWKFLYPIRSQFWNPPDTAKRWAATREIYDFLDLVLAELNPSIYA